MCLCTTVCSMAHFLMFSPIHLYFITQLLPTKCFPALQTGHLVLWTGCRDHNIFCGQSDVGLQSSGNVALGIYVAPSTVFKMLSCLDGFKCYTRLVPSALACLVVGMKSFSPYGHPLSVEPGGCCEQNGR
mmetsp:Transcript_37397/g.61505  ORF Transcript_37397/g.61505 Transcript_37397/m.61505 type:complete len:130 (-) Transcript_37397:403-792(-)